MALGAAKCDESQHLLTRVALIGAMTVGQRSLTFDGALARRVANKNAP